MRQNNLDYEKTIVAEAVNSTSIKKQRSTENARESSEWVSAASTRAQANKKISDSQKRAPTSSDMPRSEAKAKRDVLSEFSKFDGYTREKNINFNAINEQDTEMMTAAHRKVSSADIQRRMPSSMPRQNARAQQKTSASAKPQSPTQKATALQREAMQFDRADYAQKKSSSITSQAHENARARSSAASAEWTSIKNSQAQKSSSVNRSASPTKKEEMRPQYSRTNDIKPSRTPQHPPKRQKRIFTPIDAEEVLLHDLPPKKHRISPYTGIYLALSLVLVMITIILCIGASTKITKVSIKTDDIASINSQISEICEEIKGKSYLTFNKDKVADEIKEISALVADVELKGKYPRQLSVSVLYDTPRYYASDENGKIYVTNAELKVLHIYESGEEFDKSELTKLALPRFSAEKTGQTLSFASNANYVKKITQALADYRALGHISYVSFANTQRIYFIFNGKFRCDLGNSEEIELKLKSAENTYNQSVFPAIGENSERTAVINVSVPSSATCRLDADLGITD